MQYVAPDLDSHLAQTGCGRVKQKLLVDRHAQHLMAALVQEEQIAKDKLVFPAQVGDYEAER